MNKSGHGQPPSRTTPGNQSRNRRQQQQRSVDSSDVPQEHRPVTSQAHTRTPVIVREPSALESLSRNLRNFLPINISGSGSPPSHRRRPLSFGGVIGARTSTVAPEVEWRRVQEPQLDDGERITWAAWDEMDRTKVLLLAYSSGLQIWDTSNLGAVRELLNLKTESLHSSGPVLSAAVLPTPTGSPDDFEGARPLLGILTPTHFTTLSLSTHSIIKQTSFTGASAIVARPAFIVISTTNPNTLHILSSLTLQSLHTITLTTSPVFALSLRLLAYASPAPNTPIHGTPSPTFVSRHRESLGTTVREMWSGVKAVAASLGTTDGEHPWGFSRSAPAAPSLSLTQVDFDTVPDNDHAAWVTVLDLMPLLSAGQSPRRVAHFAPFPPEHPGVSRLTFSGVGATPMLSVAPTNGQRIAVFQIRVSPARGRGAEADMEMPWHWYDLRRGLTSARVDNVVWEKAGRWVGVATGRRTIHVFPTNPYGGKPDERSHLAAQIHNAGELQPLSTEITPLVRLRPSTTAPPSIEPMVEPAPLAFTFLPHSASLALPPTLLPHTSASSTPTARSSHSSPVSLSPIPGASPGASRGSFQDMLLFDPATGELALRRIAVDFVIPAPDSSGMTYNISVPGATGYSMSLPMPIVGRGQGRGRRPSDPAEKTGELIGKESVVATWPLKRSKGWAEVRGAVPHAVVAPLAQPVGGERMRNKVSMADYLAQAELSTHSRSPAVLPRPIYLSHQFSFYGFGEDYHALLRRSQFNVPCTKIEVRKDVEVSAYANDAQSDIFLHGAEDLQADGRDRRNSRGSFDEPIASAMRSGLDYSGQSPPVLPMLPNGASLSVLDTIPIHTKHVAAGVNEGFGRIRREISKVRSPILRPARHAPLELEFDEADEAVFLEGEADADERDHEGTSHDGGSGSGASVSVSTPSSRSRADLDLGGEGDEGDTMWDAWDDEAHATVAEAEMFDEISATGFMDEEHTHAPIMAAMSMKQGTGKGKGKGNRR
ncbi:hypothetical protein K439DRAFT_1631042 [Ramaria rubella]|nr:hypothetical protein K439DRAFT_1631042 [Ramaria rubella]